MLPPNPATSPSLRESIHAVADELLVSAGTDSAPATLAGIAAQRFEELTSHLAQLVGDMGVRALFARSVADARAAHAWLASIPSTDAPWTELREAMERQNLRAIRDAFAELLAAFMELLARLIGDGLVRRFLHDVWPEVFPQLAKETT